MKIEDFSPLAGMLTGKGKMGKLIAQGFGGMIPAAIARDARDAAAAEEAERNRKAASVGDVGTVTKMKSGGKASASKRGDGIAQRGKTKGRMI